MISALLWVLGHTQRIATIGEKRRTRMKKDRDFSFSLFPPDGESIIYLDRLVPPVSRTIRPSPSLSHLLGIRK
jgi:hypothetical protein